MPRLVISLYKATPFWRAAGRWWPPDGPETWVPSIPEAIIPGGYNHRYWGRTYLIYEERHLWARRPIQVPVPHPKTSGRQGPSGGYVWTTGHPKLNNLYLSNRVNWKLITKLRYTSLYYVDSSSTLLLRPMPIRLVGMFLAAKWSYIIFADILHSQCPSISLICVQEGC